MSIFDKYDLVDVDETVPIPEKPAKGVILVVGSSGSGKSTILREWGMSVPRAHPADMRLVDLFPSEEEAEQRLIAAGLRSVPTWRRPLHTLSNGERHRAEVALSLAWGGGFIDEFTSVVDRDTARALCCSLNRTEKPDFMAIATCHRDVASWLDFDQLYDTDSREWRDRGSVRRDNAITLDIRPAEAEHAWRIFKKHHYLSGKINKSCLCWVAYIGDKPVAMTAALAFPNGNFNNGWREHRTVVLPEFQGMGIGSALSDTVAEHFVRSGKRYFSKTAHPAFGSHRERSPNWSPTSKNRKRRKDYSLERKTKEDAHRMQHAHRLCYSHEYKPVDG